MDPCNVDVDNGAGGYDVQFYTHLRMTGTRWTQLGTDVAHSVRLYMQEHQYVDGRFVGAGGCLSRCPGRIYYAEVRDGIDGTVVASFDANDAAEPYATCVSSQTGETWTFNRSSSGRKLDSR